jgi:hypothetical protein
VRTDSVVLVDWDEWQDNDYTDASKVPVLPQDLQFFSVFFTSFSEVANTYAEAYSEASKVLEESLELKELYTMMLSYADTEAWKVFKKAIGSSFKDTVTFVFKDPVKDYFIVGYMAKTQAQELQSLIFQK